MLFSSLVFLWLFLPITLILYLLVMHFGRENKIGNVILLVASLIFYAWGEPIYIILMVVSALINYLFGLLIGMEKYRNKVFVALTVVVDIGILGFFKNSIFLLVMRIRFWGATLFRSVILRFRLKFPFIHFRQCHMLLMCTGKK